jgi:hypothetical protein
VTLRFAAGLALVLGVGLLLGYLEWIGEGIGSGAQELHLRAMKERTSPPDSLVPFTFADFAALPHGQPLAEFAALERRGVSLEGYVKLVEQSSDGDYHLNLTSTPPSLGVQRLTLTAELTPEWQRGSATWRWEPLLTALQSSSWWMPLWPDGPRRVRVSGWLMYDFQYDEPFVPITRPRLPGPTPSRLTGWEIHPVTRIELWDDSLQAFVEYPR